MVRVVDQGYVYKPGLTELRKDAVSTRKQGLQEARRTRVSLSDTALGARNTQSPITLETMVSPLHTNEFHSESTFKRLICSQVQQSWLRYPTNTIGYEVPYYNNAFHTNNGLKNKEKNKESIFNFIRQYLEK